MSGRKGQTEERAENATFLLFPFPTVGSSLDPLCGCCLEFSIESPFQELAALPFPSRNDAVLHFRARIKEVTLLQWSRRRGLRELAHAASQQSIFPVEGKKANLSQIFNLKPLGRYIYVYIYIY